jgi:SAM-dependent methyltransferase
MSNQWSAQRISEVVRSYQSACVLAAAAELDLFDVLAERPLTAMDIAGAVGGDLRATTILLDALAALGFIHKSQDRYSASEDVAALLTRRGSQNVLATIQHQANCLRNWSQLASVVKSGRPAPRIPSVRGPEGDTASFIGAMHDRAAVIADGLIRKVNPAAIRHFLDVGGGSGSYTLAFLRANRNAIATLFDLPPVILLAQKRLSEAGFTSRAKLVPGNFESDPIPAGADFVWLSAIIHQNSREENRRLFAKSYAALVPGGRVAIRDMVMDSSRTSPVSGALFAVNMLVATQSGGTFTFDEITEDLASAGFKNATLVSQDEGMDSIVVAEKK